MGDSRLTAMQMPSTGMHAMLVLYCPVSYVLRCHVMSAVILRCPATPCKYTDLQTHCLEATYTRQHAPVFSA